jgi:glutamine synthetase
MKIKLEYVWLDGYQPEPNLRSKVKVIDSEHKVMSLDEVPEWNFDGSSTKQAEGSLSDCILKPVRLYQNQSQHVFPQDKTIFVFCEVMNPDGTPHESNSRNSINEDNNFWVGFEQEYFIRDTKTKQILGHNSILEPQGKYYCGVGKNVVGRKFVEEHMDYCLSLGINITGINAEVAMGQWEYQVFSKGNKKACDDLWMSRYIMEKISENYGYTIEYHPKPLGQMDWNGSGLHTNFSTKKMREVGGEQYFKSIFQAFEVRHDKHIEVYGSDNNMRLTGKHETQSINKFSWGISDRGASIRVPKATSLEWKGYLEDRRPASNANPYNIIQVISITLELAEKLGEVHNNMYSNVNFKNTELLIEKYKTLSNEELMKEYLNDDNYELTEEMMESKANVKTEEIKFNPNSEA